MARFHGVIGYGVGPVETKPGVWKDVIVEKKYYGDVLRASRDQVDSDKVNSDITVGNSISVLADAYLREHLTKISYVEWQGELWTVSNIEDQRPRMILRLGGLYNGKRPERDEASGAA